MNSFTYLVPLGRAEGQPPLCQRLHTPATLPNPCLQKLSSCSPQGDPGWYVNRMLKPKSQVSPCCECGPRGERWRWSTCPPGLSRVSGTPPELPVRSAPPSTAGHLQVDSPAQWHSSSSWSNESQPASRWTISLKTLTWRITPHPPPPLIWLTVLDNKSKALWPTPKHLFYLSHWWYFVLVKN